MEENKNPDRFKNAAALFNEIGNGGMGCGCAIILIPLILFLLYFIFALITS